MEPAANPPSSAPEGAPADAAGWQALPARAAIVNGVAGAVSGLLLSLPLQGYFLVEGEDWATRLPGMLGLAALLLAIGAATGWARSRRTRWQLDERGLQVRRGLWWRSEILVPRSRVQHLDLERGPIERRLGLATLIVHTAGTRQQALRQAGLDEACATRLRDALVPAPDRHDDAL